MDITAHLIYFCRQHIDTHGATDAAGRYIKANVELWTEKYGKQVAEKVRADVAGYFRSKRKW
jgi:hypothetical protein